jgi:hypothetical protein
VGGGGVRWGDVCCLSDCYGPLGASAVAREPQSLNGDGGITERGILEQKDNEFLLEQKGSHESSALIKLSSQKPMWLLAIFNFFFFSQLVALTVTVTFLSQPIVALGL